VLRECLLRTLIEVKAAPAGARAIGTAAAAPPARCGVVGVIIAVVGGRYFVVFIDLSSSSVECLYG